MNIKAVSVALVFGFSASTFAADQAVSFFGNTAQFGSQGFPPILDGGDDLISFTGLPTGAYKFLFTFSSQNINFLAGQTVIPVFGNSLVLSNSNIAVNGIGAQSFSNSATLGGSLQATGSTPFSVYLKGTPGSQALYSGEISVTAVPEPETYAMMLAGLGALGFIAFRRRKG